MIYTITTSKAFQIQTGRLKLEMLPNFINDDPNNLAWCGEIYAKNWSDAYGFIIKTAIFNTKAKAKTEANKIIRIIRQLKLSETDFFVSINTNENIKEVNTIAEAVENECEIYATARTEEYSQPLKWTGYIYTSDKILVSKRGFNTEAEAVAKMEYDLSKDFWIHQKIRDKNAVRERFIYTLKLKNIEIFEPKIFDKQQCLYTLFWMSINQGVL